MTVNETYQAACENILAGLNLLDKLFANMARCL